jgi:hypothetical protein
MNKELAFLSLDFRLLKPYRKTLFILPILGLVIGFWFDSTLTMLSAFMMMVLILVMPYPFAISEKNGLDTLYGTLALERKTVVIGRYFFALALLIVTMIITIILALLLSLINMAEFDFQEVLLTISLLSGIFFVITAIQYPIYFKFGYNRTRLVPMLTGVGILLLIRLLAELNTRLGWDVEGYDWDAFFTSFWGCVLPVLLGLGLLALSCAISCRIYTKRDI